MRDKEKHAVDFLAVVDGKTVCMVEVKVGNDNFSSSLFRFHAKLPTARPYQLVHNLKRLKSKASARMLPAHEFFRNFRLQ